jgi:hypothetical protein
MKRSLFFTVNSDSIHDINGLYFKNEMSQILQLDYIINKQRKLRSL